MPTPSAQLAMPPEKLGQLNTMDNNLFVSKYQLKLPKKEDIQHFIERQIAESPIKNGDSKTGRLVRELRENYGTERDEESSEG